MLQTISSILFSDTMLQIYLIIPVTGCYYKGNLDDSIRCNPRSFSTAKVRKDSTYQTNKQQRIVPSKFITSVLSTLNTSESVLGNDESSQRKIENLTFDEFESVFAGNKNKFMLGGINSELVNPLVGKYFLEKEKDIFLYINNLLKSQSENLNSKKILKGKNNKVLLIAKLFTGLSVDNIANAIKVQFLTVYTYEDTDEDKYYTVLPVAVKLGKQLFNKYINTLRDAYTTQNDSLKEGKEILTYST